MYFERYLELKSIVWKEWQMPNHVHGIIFITVGAIHELPPQNECRKMLLWGHKLGREKEGI